MSTVLGSRTRFEYTCTLIEAHQVRHIIAHFLERERRVGRGRNETWEGAKKWIEASDLGPHIPPT